MEPQVERVVSGGYTGRGVHGVKWIIVGHWEVGVAWGSFWRYLKGKKMPDFVVDDWRRAKILFIDWFGIKNI